MLWFFVYAVGGERGWRIHHHSSHFGLQKPKHYTSKPKRKRSRFQARHYTHKTTSATEFGTCSQCRSFLYSFLFFNKREKRLDSLYEAAAVGVVFMRSKMSIVLSKYFSGVTSWHTCIKTGSVTVPQPCCARPFKMAERGK